FRNVVSIRAQFVCGNRFRRLGRSKKTEIQRERCYRVTNWRQPISEHQVSYSRRSRSSSARSNALLPVARIAGISPNDRRELSKRIWSENRCGECRRWPRRQGLRAILLRNFSRSRRFCAFVHAAISNL